MANNLRLLTACLLLCIFAQASDEDSSSGSWDSSSSFDSDSQSSDSDSSDSFDPSFWPSTTPSAIRTSIPSLPPIVSDLSRSPTVDPTAEPTLDSTGNPTHILTVNPSTIPSQSPSVNPSTAPSQSPSVNPSTAPSQSPSMNPTASPSNPPTKLPTLEPSFAPTAFCVQAQHDCLASCESEFEDFTIFSASDTTKCQCFMEATIDEMESLIESGQITIQSLEEMPVNIDIQILLDATGSMGAALQAMSDSMIAMIDNISANVKSQTGSEAILRVGVVGYRDPFAGAENEFIAFTEDNAAVDAFLNNLQARGGGDYPEDVNGGLTIMLDQEWTSEHKFIIHITDAPALGEDGPDEAGIMYQDLFAQINEKAITYVVGRMSSDVDNMIANFNSVYAVNEQGVTVADPSETEIQVLDLAGLGAAALSEIFTTELVSMIVERIQSRKVKFQVAEFPVCDAEPEMESIRIAATCSGMSDANKDDVCEGFASSLNAHVTNCELLPLTARRRLLQIRTLEIDLEVTDAREAETRVASDDFLQTVELPEGVTVEEVHFVDGGNPTLTTTLVAKPEVEDYIVSTSNASSKFLWLIATCAIAVGLLMSVIGYVKTRICASKPIEKDLEFGNPTVWSWPTSNEIRSCEARKGSKWKLVE